MARRHLGKKSAKDIAHERIERLFELAEQQALAGQQPRAKRYVLLALRLGERHKVRPGHKRTYCPSCHAYFVPSRNLRVRKNRGRVTMTCLECGHIIRFPTIRRTK